MNNPRLALKEALRVSGIDPNDIRQIVMKCGAAAAIVDCYIQMEFHKREYDDITHVRVENGHGQVLPWRSPLKDAGSAPRE